jgi:uncharacterized protein (TIGR02246 family)
MREADLEAIRTLKARYCRLLDTKQWDAFAELFTEDARMHSGPADHPPVVGRRAIADYVRDHTAALVTVHRVHAPEIEATGPDGARGIWAMSDALQGPGGFWLEGSGHYHERYRRDADGRWRIASTRLTRLRVASSDPAVTRSLWPEAPDWAVAPDQPPSTPTASARRRMPTEMSRSESDA